MPTADVEGAHELPGEGEPVGGFADDEHAGDEDGHLEHDHGHGHDDHHDDHGTGGNAWVLVPIGVGLVIGLILAVYFGLGSGASPL